MDANTIAQLAGALGGSAAADMGQSIPASVSIVLTDADLLAGVGTFQLIAAPPANVVIMPIAAYAEADFTGGVYSAPLQFVIGPAPLVAAGWGIALTGTIDATNAIAQSSAAILQTGPLPALAGSLGGQPLQLQIAGGPVVGGNVANWMRVSVLYAMLRAGQ